MSDALMRPSDPKQMSGGGVVREGSVTTSAKDDPNSLPRGSVSGPKSTPLFLTRKPRKQDKSLMNLTSVIDEAFEEREIVAELHAPIISPPVSADDSDGLRRTATSKSERGRLRVNTQLGHVVRPPSSIARSSIRLSAATSSESDRDDVQRIRAVRPVTSLPSFHPRGRPTSFRERGSETPPLTSESHSSLTSISAISQNSCLYTPPHSSPTAPSFVYTETTYPTLHHLAAISELRDTEDHSPSLSLDPFEAKSTQSLTRVDRPDPSSMVHNENEGGSATITPRSVPLVLEAYLPRTESPTGTVTGLLLNGASSATTGTTTTTISSLHDLSSPLSLSSFLSAAPRSLSPAVSSPPSSTGGGGLGWPFGSRTKRGEDALVTKAQKAEEKRRKKDEARARKARLAEELRKRDKEEKADTVSLYSTRNNERILSRPWEEDIAMYGSLASM
ncbi:hypothetical protein BGW80DRAFT_1274725 [Lactifluus volemus]|nr:hypothetical protein BGW80DRAFT_1274725 [Lactifluus volemus]